MYTIFLPAYNSAKIIKKIHQDFSELWSQMYCHLFYVSRCIYNILYTAAIRITVCSDIFVADDDADDCTKGAEGRWRHEAAAWSGGRKDCWRRLWGDVEARSWKNVSSWLQTKGLCQVTRHSTVCFLQPGVSLLKLLLLLTSSSSWMFQYQVMRCDGSLAFMKCIMQRTYAFKKLKVNLGQRHKHSVCAIGSCNSKKRKLQKYKIWCTVFWWHILAPH